MSGESSPKDIAASSSALFYYSMTRSRCPGNCSNRYVSISENQANKAAEMKSDSNDGGPGEYLKLLLPVGPSFAPLNPPDLFGPLNPPDLFVSQVGTLAPSFLTGLFVGEALASLDYGGGDGGRGREALPREAELLN